MTDNELIERLQRAVQKHGVSNGRSEQALLMGLAAERLVVLIAAQPVVVVTPAAMAGLTDALGGDSGAVRIDITGHELDDMEASGQAYSLDGRYNFRDVQGCLAQRRERFDALEQDLALNAAMLATQTDLAREAENVRDAAQQAHQKCAEVALDTMHRLDAACLREDAAVTRAEAAEAQVALIQDDMVGLGKLAMQREGERDDARAQVLDLAGRLSFLCSQDIDNTERAAKAVLLTRIDVAEAALTMTRQELEIVRAEATRAALHYTFKGYSAGENADSKHWRLRAEAAEQASYPGYKREKAMRCAAEAKVAELTARIETMDADMLAALKRFSELEG